MRRLRTPSRRVALLALAAYGAIGLWATANRRLRVRDLLGWTILLFLAWTGASLAWSIDPVTTFRKLVVLAFLCLGALASAKLFSPTQVLVFALFTSLLALVMGVCSEVALGTFRPLMRWYRYSGLTWPAFSAWSFSLLFFASLILQRKGKIGNGFAYVTAAAAVVFIVLAKSRGAAAAFLVGVMAYASLLWPGYRKVVFACAGCLVVTGTLLFAEFSGVGASRASALALS